MTEAFPDNSISEEDVRAALERIDLAEFADPEIIDFVCKYTPKTEAFEPKGLPLRVGDPYVSRGEELWYLGYHDEEVKIAEIDFLSSINGIFDGTHKLGFSEDIDHHKTVLMASLLQSFIAYAALVESKRLPRVEVLTGATNIHMVNAGKRFGFVPLREIMVQHFESSNPPSVTEETVEEIAGEITSENEYEFFEMVLALGSISEGTVKSYFDELFNLKFRERYPAAEKPKEDEYEVFARYDMVLERMTEYVKKHYTNYLTRARKIAEAALTKD